ncbi:MAG: TRAP transporter large permease subunit [Lawsonibacter sp.]|nr:TRAP transporter large permease subunit [Lawsonibacter sp.]
MTKRTRCWYASSRSRFTVSGFAIGLLTPPVGSLLYTIAAATNLSADRMIRSIWPWISVLFAVLMLVTYCPVFTTWLPSVL